MSHRSQHDSYFNFQRQELIKGYRPALLQVIVYCKANDLPIPPWAREALADAFSQYLGCWNKETKKWEPEVTGVVLSGPDEGRGSKRPSLDELLGMKGKGGRRSQYQSEYADFIHWGEIINVECLMRETGMSEKDAVIELANRRGEQFDDAKKLINRFKQMKYNYKRRKRRRLI